VAVQAVQTITGVTDSPEFQASFIASLLAVLPSSCSVYIDSVTPVARRQLLAGVSVRYRVASTSPTLTAAALTNTLSSPSSLAAVTQNLAKTFPAATVLPPVVTTFAPTPAPSVAAGSSPGTGGTGGGTGGGSSGGGGGGGGDGGGIGAGAGAGIGVGVAVVLAVAITVGVVVGGRSAQQQKLKEQQEKERLAQLQLEQDEEGGVPLGQPAPPESGPEPAAAEDLEMLYFGKVLGERGGYIKEIGSDALDVPPPPPEAAETEKKRATKKSTLKGPGHVFEEFGCTVEPELDEASLPSAGAAASEGTLDTPHSSGRADVFNSGGSGSVSSSLRSLPPTTAEALEALRRNQNTLAVLTTAAAAANRSLSFSAPPSPSPSPPTPPAAPAYVHSTVSASPGAIEDDDDDDNNSGTPDVEASVLSWSRAFELGPPNDEVERDRLNPAYVAVTSRKEATVHGVRGAQGSSPAVTASARQSVQWGHENVGVAGSATAAARDEDVLLRVASVTARLDATLAAAAHRSKVLSQPQPPQPTSSSPAPPPGTPPAVPPAPAGTSPAAFSPRVFRDAGGLNNVLQRVDQALHCLSTVAPESGLASDEEANAPTAASPRTPPVIAMPTAAVPLRRFVPSQKDSPGSSSTTSDNHDMIPAPGDASQSLPVPGPPTISVARQRSRLLSPQIPPPMLPESVRAAAVAAAASPRRLVPEHGGDTARTETPPQPPRSSPPQIPPPMLPESVRAAAAAAAASPWRSVASPRRLPVEEGTDAADTEVAPAAPVVPPPPLRRPKASSSSSVFTAPRKPKAPAAPASDSEDDDDESDDMPLSPLAPPTPPSPASGNSTPTSKLGPPPVVKLPGAPSPTGKGRGREV